MQLIVDKSNQTFVINHGRVLNITILELKKFFGICMLMSCLQYPIIRMYWDRRWKVPAIANNMSRNRFFTIRTSLKVVVDGDISEDARKMDRLWKIRPLIEKVRLGCLKQERTQDVAVDEMMVPFSGVSELKQYVPNKPNPVGLKIFALANPNGVLGDFIFYQGKQTFPTLTDMGFGLGESAVLRLTESLTPGHIIYHDRFFTSVKLIVSLYERGFLSTGTINKNRIPKEARLKSDKDLNKIGRGTSDMLVHHDEKFALIKWMDKKGITMMSSAHGTDPTDMCQRYNKKDKKYIQVKRPMVIKKYNEKMGGIDLFDRMMSYCPIKARTKKWTIRTIFHLIDMAVVNSWLQLKLDLQIKGTQRKNIPQLRKFKLLLGESLIYSESGSDSSHSDEDQENNEVEQDLVPSQTKKRKLPVALPSEGMRKKGIDHLPIMENIPNWQKCRKPGCKERTRTKCKKCNIFLCLVPKRNCFTSYHEA